MTLHYLTLLLLCVLVSALFSMMETAFVSVSRLRAKSLFKQGKRGSEALVRLKERPREVLITLLLWNNAANVAASAAATILATNAFGSTGVGIAVGGVTLVLLLFGDVLPKTFASSNSELVAPALAPFMEITTAASAPLVLPLALLAKAASQILGGEARKPLITESDLDSLVAIAVEEGAVGANEARLVRDALDFNDHLVESVMTPASAVEFIPAGFTVAQALENALASRYQRFPVVGDGKTVVGVVSEKKLAEVSSRGKGGEKVTAMMLQPLFVQMHTPISHVFELMQKRKRKLAVVNDAKGATLGIIALEDILEEIIDDLNNFKPDTLVKASP
mgnify:FL=1